MKQLWQNNNRRGKVRANLLLAVLALLLLQSCNALKYVPEDEKLYTGADLKIYSEGGPKGKKELASAVNEAIYPKPNSKFLWMRVALWAHYKVDSNEANFITRFINKRFGEEPVYLSDVQPQEVEKLIENRAINNGYFYPEIRSSIKEKKRTASVTYSLTVGKPYLLETYQHMRDSLDIDTLIKSSFAETELEHLSRFDLDLFKKERGRIDNYLKDRGYYQFNKEYLIFTSDTNQYPTRLYDQYLDIKNKVPLKDQLPYQIHSVKVYPDYSVENFEQKDYDSVMVDSISFLQEELLFKPNLLREYIIVEPGDYYNKRFSDISTRRLSSLGIYQFASIRYDAVDSLLTDSLGYLDATILLTPGNKYALRAGMQGITKSTGFAGPGVYATFQNRNLFNGGEILDITGNVSYEFQLAKGSGNNLNNFEFKLENSLTIPRLKVPFIKTNPKKVYALPSTRFELNYTLQQRALYYTINSFLLSYGFIFNTSRFIFQEFTPVSLNYMSVSNRTPEFERILNNNRFLARSFDNQFIPSMEYSFQYSELGKLPEQNHEFYLNATVAQAGFILGLIKSGQSDKSILGQPFAQYLKGDVDFRHYFKIDEERQLVSRLFVGVGYPYGNSISLPYIKQYFSGGPNSVRAFQVRSVGPGSFNPPDTGQLTFFDQSGDIRLELNTEYRFPIVSLLKGALFVDAGNIWLMNNNPDIPGGQFSQDWSQQLAVGTGFGLRLDIDVLVIRFDIAHPLRYPYEVDGSHAVNSFGFDKVVWNFAIGYPF